MGRGESGKTQYGTEFKMLYQDGNVKYIKYQMANNAAVPDYTKTPNRVYAVINRRNDVKFVAFYDEDGKKYMQIDVSGKSHTVDGITYKTPHVHLGKTHDENGTRGISAEEKEYLDRILKTWYNHLGG